MEEKKQNKNALRSKHLIRQGFISLIKNKADSSNLTITDIVNAAGINRATFYAHYSCIKDLTDEIEKEILDKMMNVLNQFHFDNFCTHPTPILLQVSMFLAENEDYYKTLISVPECDQFLNKLLDIFIAYIKEDTSIPEEIRHSKAFLIRASYFAGGLSNLYVEYFKGKLDCSLYDIPAEVGLIFQELDVNSFNKRMLSHKTN